MYVVFNTNKKSFCYNGVLKYFYSIKSILNKNFAFNSYAKTVYFYTDSINVFNMHNKFLDYLFKKQVNYNPYILHIVAIRNKNL